MAFHVSWKAAQLDRKIEEAALRQAIRAAHNQRRDHGPARGDILSHRVLKCSGDPLDGARGGETKRLGKRLIGEAGRARGPV